MCSCYLQRKTLDEINEKHKEELRTQSKADFKKRMAEEDFLKKCIDDADEELDQEKEQHEETKRQLKDLQVSGSMNSSIL